MQTNPETSESCDGKANRQGGQKGKSIKENLGKISCPKSEFRRWQRLYIANVAEVTDIKITQYGLHTDYSLLFLADFGRSYTTMVLLWNIRVINFEGILRRSQKFCHCSNYYLFWSLGLSKWNNCKRMCRLCGLIWLIFVING